MLRRFRNCTSSILQCSIHSAGGMARGDHLFVAARIQSFQPGTRIGDESAARLVEEPGADAAGELLSLAQ
jgi:hypothetical protein